MKTYRLLLALVAWLPAIAHCAPNVDAGVIECSAIESSSSAAVVFIGCTGNLVIANGVITAEEEVTFYAAGSLRIEDLSISVPLVTLSAQTVFLGEGATIQATSAIQLTGGASSSSGFNAGSGAAVILGSGTHTRTLRGDELAGAFIHGPRLDAPLSGGTITVTPSVPELEMLALILCGLLALMARFPRASNGAA